jgi:hypothetical protein
MSLDDVPTSDAWAVGRSCGIDTVTVTYVDYPGFARVMTDLVVAGVHVIGTWIDRGLIHVDAVDLIEDRGEAWELAWVRGEASIYNLQTEELVWVCGAPEAQSHRSPGFTPDDDVAKLKSAEAQRRQRQGQRRDNQEHNVR